MIKYILVKLLSEYLETLNKITSYSNNFSQFISGEKLLICDGSTLSINCPNAEDVIVFEKAFYGRSDTRTCTSAAAGRARDTSCTQDTALATMNEHCFGKSACDVSVGRRTFNDPCPGTSKYLSAVYECVPSRFSMIIFQLYIYCAKFYGDGAKLYGN